MGERPVLVVVEPELGRLDRDLAVETAGLDLVEDVDVVVGDGVGLGEARQVLAEPRVQRRDAGGLERRGGVERGRPSSRPA